MKLAILGGSSPFTTSLLHKAAVSRERFLDPFDAIVLQGRDESILRTIAYHGQQLFGERSKKRITFDTNIECAVSGADVVLVQVRFGGSEFRRDIEKTCEHFATFSDETLGAGGLTTALAFGEEWILLGQTLYKHAPSALVVNMMNPLSLSSVLLANAGSNIVGLCEGPIAIVQKLARHINQPCANLNWLYNGLNHRGFIHSVCCNGYPIKSADVSCNGVGNNMASDYSTSLQAYISKEFRMAMDRSKWSYERAAVVHDARGRMLRALDGGIFPTEALLDLRPTPWYSQAVLPFLAAWTGQTSGWISTVNRYEDGIVRERRAYITERGIRTFRDTFPNNEVAMLVARIEEHERACLRCLDSATMSSVLDAVSMDPTIVSGNDLGSVANVILTVCANWRKRDLL